MKINKIFLFLVSVLVFTGIILSVRFLFGGDEDNWICANGQWIAHGHPSTPKPTTGCGQPIIPTSQEDNNQVTLTYQPKQCQTTPWQDWYQSGKTQFIKAPTEDELIFAYYSSLSIPVANAQRVSSGLMVCQACDTCPTDFFFQLQTTSDGAEKLIKNGWVKK